MTTATATARTTAAPQPRATRLPDLIIINCPRGMAGAFPFADTIARSFQTREPASLVFHCPTLDLLQQQIDQVQSRSLPHIVDPTRQLIAHGDFRPEHLATTLRMRGLLRRVGQIRLITVSVP